MIKKMTQSAAYICASCGKFIYRDFEIFSLTSALPYHINCTSRCKSGAVISDRGDKYSVSYVCPFCGETHEYSIKKTMFWKTDLFSFDCPFAEMSVFFIGDKKKIEKELQLQADELEELDELASETADASMYYIIVAVKEKYLHGKILCHCGSQDVAMDINGDSLVIRCKSCNSEKTLHATENEYINLITADNIII